MKLLKRGAYGLIVLILFIAGCTTPANDDNKPDNHNDQLENEQLNAGLTDEQADDFPRTIEWNGQEIEIKSKPKRIAALSLDAADAVLELVDAADLAAIADSIENSNLAINTDKAAKIEGKVSGSFSIDPEKILYYEPDLILLTKQHGSESDAEQILNQSGIPLISFSPWTTLDQIAANMTVIGQVTGEEALAEQVVKNMKERIETVQHAVEDVEDPPSTLVISPVGSNTGPFLPGSTSLANEVVRLAGAVPAAELMGLEQTTKATIEQVIKADPEYIVFANWSGDGEAAFSELMEAPGWETLQAVEHDRVLILDGKYLMTPNIHVASGVEQIAQWIFPERFEEKE